MIDAVIVDAVRTPIGKGKANGALHGVHAVDLLAHSLRALVERTGIDPAIIEDVIGGNVTQVGEQGGNITRRALLAAGYPDSVPGVSIDRACGSSQQAIHFAAQGIMSGAYEVVVAAGVESMSRVTMGTWRGDSTDTDGDGLRARYPEGLVNQGIAAELIAAKWELTRQQLDEFSLASHEKAAAATASGVLDSQLAPIAGLEHDEGIRAGSTVEMLAGLKPAYFDEAIAERFPQIGWNVTAAGASQVSDGSSAVLLMSAAKAAELGLKPLARIHSFSVVGDDPLYMLTGVIPATRKVLERVGLTIDDIDLFEINEAFAPVVLSWAKELNVPLEKVNIHGGAIAIGHPLGASGARLMTTMVHALQETGGRYALQTMCEAGGMANATIIERL
ncbi:MAG: fadA12 [Microbacteriaceae bacterium]|nr:fadA12 [Microbacteriaceae bacterium]